MASKTRIELSSSIGTERWHEESFATSQCMRNEKRKELIREKKRMEFFGLSQELILFRIPTQCSALARLRAEGQEPSRAKIQAAYSDSGAKTASPLLIRSRTEAMKKVNSQLSLSPGIESEECSKLPCSHPSLDIEASKASTASTNPFPVLGGPLLQGNLFHQ
ncbi:hypothetical protein FNV43_RR08287 [Rhamnella rubrinervis]|uniref:Uncharacterized protein n=1 Tax=Rhamnella rubrinervis TaxID=2594499 RepID=A0A8K0HI75_9ROSA|nr:hypothetical protein FNV43_RR08287 [Rhamnella rubrinervis]